MTFKRQKKSTFSNKAGRDQELERDERNHFESKGRIETRASQVCSILKINGCVQSLTQ